MEALEDTAQNNIIVKGKRTKRLRPHSPLPFSVPTNSSTAEGGDSSGAADSNHLHIAVVANSNSASSPANSYDLLQQQESSEEDEDLANCLILLAQGQSREESKAASIAIAASTVPAAAKAGFYAYECKTCNRTFPSFQALGGHRASHKKPKAFVEEKKIFGFLDEEEAQLKPLTLQLSARSLNGGGGKSRVHECSICGAEFTSGQALGGHMRRHRAPIPMPISVPIPISSVPAANTVLSLNPFASRRLESEQSKRPRTLLSLDLDLNLPAPDDDHKFAFTPKQQQQQKQQQLQQQQQQQQQQQPSPLMFPAPTLVDCHY